MFAVYIIVLISFRYNLAVNVRSDRVNRRRIINNVDDEDRGEVDSYKDRYLYILNC